MAPLEFHGHALNTILTGRAIHTLPSAGRLPVYLGCALVSVLSFRRPNVKYGLAVVVLLSGLITLGGWLVLWGTQCWVPLGSVLVVQVLAALFVVDQRWRYSQELSGRLQVLLGAGPRNRSYPLLAAAPTPWNEMMMLVHQLFPLQRAALLIVPERRPNLQQVALWGGDAQIVRERRRDVLRSPFLEAIESRGLWRVDEYRPFFAPAGDQQQFLLPLIHAGRVKGILAWALHTETLRSLPDLAGQARDVAEELAELIARWQAVRRTERRRSTWPGRWLLLPEEHQTATLERNVRQAELRLSQMSRLVEEATIGHALCDVCGRMVLMNATMFRLLHPLGLASMDTSLFQLATALLQRSEDETRAVLRSVILERNPASFQFTSTATGTKWMLLLRPLCGTTETSSVAESFDPFRVQGVQVELIDRGSIPPSHDLDRHPAEHALNAVETLLAQANVPALGSS
jgi:hypothetical protein